MMKNNKFPSKDKSIVLIYENYGFTILDIEENINHDTPSMLFDLLNIPVSK